MYYTVHKYNYCVTKLHDHYIINKCIITVNKSVYFDSFVTNAVKHIFYNTPFRTDCIVVMELV